MAIVYMATNTVNSGVYIGATRKSLDQRRRRHLSGARSNERGCHAFYAAIRKYGESAFVWTVLVECQSFTDAAKEEVRLISEMAPRYNLTKGGEGVVGATRTREWTDKIAAALRGRKCSEDHRARMREGQRVRGKRTVTDKVRASLALGAAVSVEVRRKPIFCLTDGCHFRSALEAAQAIGVTASCIYAVCSGRQNSTKGLRFVYLNADGSIPDPHPLVVHAKRKKAVLVESQKEALRKASLGRMRRVLCLKTGIIFPSGVMAARHHDLFPIVVSRICYGKQKATRDGLRFAFVDVTDGGLS